MKSVLQIRFARVAAVCLFALAFAFSLAASVPVAHGPTMPPLPWDGVAVAHGPTMPPLPWDGLSVAHGPTMPPLPWDGVA
jgi:hypothetical protein